MSMNNKGLGRGLDALFQGARPADEAPRAAEETSPYVLLSCDALKPNPNQPRTSFSEESLRSLSESMRAQGILQPIIARATKFQGIYEIIAGERRWRAAKMAGLRQVPVIVREMDDGEALIMALIENIQREDLNPIEQAKALQKLRDALMISQEALAEKLGQSRTTVTRSLQLLKLSEAAQEDIIKGRMDPAHARYLTGIDSPQAAEELRKRIVEKGLIVRQTGEAAAFWRENKYFPWNKPGGDLENEITKISRKDIQNLATQIGASLNCKTQISGDINKGHISLAYESNEQLFELLDKLGMTIAN